MFSFFIARFFANARRTVKLESPIFYGMNMDSVRTKATASKPPALVEPASPRKLAPPETSRIAERPRRTFEDICLQIRTEMQEGRLKPGDRLPAERELAEQFGVSRNAVREALRSLEVAGVIACQRGVGGGAFIRHGDPRIITQAIYDMVLLGRISTESLTETRILLMNNALRLACTRATNMDFDAIERDIDLVEQLTHSGDLKGRSTYITNFYSLVARATHNEVMVMLIDSLSEIVRHLLDRIAPTPRTDVIEVRRAILRNLRARDAEGAVLVMTRHLERLSRQLHAKEKALTKGALPARSQAS
ncbi:FadR/GntR family transcriptional regulator [Noviherbaspirillum pedocola]|uniref:FadR family transcriptional regulator n=1 Tax=Noviherbaspirillum pedocola TaxID=2801341 RepID=A0A934T483_9BURK|nr:GntR family transcriptional regulator [Noviherbaspirillum pedocola]MBK4739013.1 FadR family transcriptional regulator [Noviherbaspirillum pedocola]